MQAKNRGLEDQLTHKINENVEEFNKAVKKDLCNQKSSVAIVIKRLLVQYRLDGAYEWSYIYNEAYTRAIRSLEREDTIANPIGWMRLTSLNVIRELSRQNRGYEFIEYLDHYYPVEEDNIDDSEAEYRIQVGKLNNALAQLTKIDRDILKLSIVEGLSFEQIRAQLSQGGCGDYTAPSLRQRKRRALKKLNSYYNAGSDIQIKTA